jgi:hypothetical protein
MLHSEQRTWSRIGNPFDNAARLRGKHRLLPDEGGLVDNTDHVARFEAGRDEGPLVFEIERVCVNAAGNENRAGLIADVFQGTPDSVIDIRF